MKKDKELKLIYVNKIGYDSKGQGTYEFIFSEDPESVDAESWGWTKIPASSNAEPPEESSISDILSLKTNLFELICLHDSDDRPYIDGYHTIHALAYENDDYVSDKEYSAMYEDMPLLVFHYGMTMDQIKDLLYERDVILKGNDLIATKSKTKTISEKPKKINNTETNNDENHDLDDVEESKDDDFFQIKF